MKGLRRSLFFFYYYWPRTLSDGGFGRIFGKVFNIYGFFDKLLRVVDCSARHHVCPNPPQNLIGDISWRNAFTTHSRRCAVRVHRSSQPTMTVKFMTVFGRLRSVSSAMHTTHETTKSSDNGDDDLIYDRRAQQWKLIFSHETRRPTTTQIGDGRLFSAK